MSNEILQKKRQSFYEKVLGTPAGSPQQSIPMICEAWREMTDASFVWLWLYNDNAGHWEVAAFAPSEGTEFAPQLLCPLEEDDSSSIVELACSTGAQVPVPDLEWSKNIEGRTFRVVCAPELERLQCKSLVCIPLLAPTGSGESKFRAAICCHFRSQLPEIQPPESALLMGRASASLILDAYKTEQLSILVELNALAERFLTRRTRNPERQRREYCEEIIQVIKTRLSVNWASIFYQNESRDMIQCVATTGLWNANKIQIDKTLLADVFYAPHQSLTGEVFATCKPFFNTIGGPNPRSSEFPKYVYRETPVERDEAMLPWIIYPIRQPRDTRSKEKCELALGVIRCVGNKARLVKDQPRNFDPIQVKTLEFISKQLAPVLETMAVHIERERSVTIIKHDLFAPLRMIEDEVSEITRSFQEKEEIGSYALPNLLAATMIAKNLVDMLDADPAEALRAFNPQATGLEGDIVARVKNMLSHYARVANGMKIEFEPIRDTIPRLYIDRNLTERLLCNLILNAVKYGKRGSTIRVMPREESNWYCLDVINEGIGVESVDEERIFRGRYRGRNARKFGRKGLGLGLKISRAAMEKHRGRLVLTSGAKEGTVFTIQFPKRLEVPR